MTEPKWIASTTTRILWSPFEDIWWIEGRVRYFRRRYVTPQKDRMNHGLKLCSSTSRRNYCHDAWWLWTKGQKLGDESDGCRKRSIEKFVRAYCHCKGASLSCLKPFPFILKCTRWTVCCGTWNDHLKVLASSSYWISNTQKVCRHFDWPKKKSSSRVK